MTAYFYDLEFHDDGKTIDPISIGIVTDDGREYYAVNADADWPRIRDHAWLMANVVPHLPPAALRLIHGVGGSASHPVVKQRWQIAHEVSEFIRAGGEDRDGHQLFAYYGAYDHVALAQLWGPMISLPPWVPMFSHDLKSMEEGLRSVDFPASRPAQGDEHHALADARWNMAYWHAQIEASQHFRAQLAIPDGYVLLPEPTAARLIERMLSEGPNEGISYEEDRDLRAWWETYVYPPGEPEAGDGGEVVSDIQWAALEAQQNAEDKAEDAQS